MAPRIRTLAFSALCAAALAVPAGAREAGQGMTAAFGKNGLASLCWAGRELLHNGMPRVTGAFFMKPDGTTRAADLTTVRTTADPDARTVALTFPWGDVAVKYAPAGDRLNVEVALETKRSADTLAGLYLHVMELKFPQPPRLENRSFLFYMKAPVAHNLGGPGILGAEWKEGAVVLCNEQVARPLAFGLGDRAEGEKTVRPVLAYTGRHPTLLKKFPFIARPLHPGGRDHWELSLSFTRPGGGIDAAAADLYERFAKAYPPKVNWKDRRPIGRLFISTSPRKGFPPPGNPRGWFNARDVDVTTEEGVKAFQERALKWADNCVKICTAMNAQGVVLWDTEGQENPHPISYLGDPRSLPPEFDPIADAFFRKFTDAGLRTGLTIRPQRPLRSVYGAKVFQLGFAGRRDRLNNLSDKIKHAQKRWGCTLFYMDSNVDWYGDPWPIPGAGGHTAMVDDRMLAELTARHPDVLILPEWETVRTYAYSAPYTQLNYNKLLAPPAPVLRAYPGAFFVNAITAKLADQHHGPLVESVRRGDILFFDGWYGAGVNAKAKAIYEQAGARDRRQKPEGQ